VGKIKNVKNVFYIYGEAYGASPDLLEEFKERRKEEWGKRIGSTRMGGAITGDGEGTGVGKGRDRRPPCVRYVPSNFSAVFAPMPGNDRDRPVRNVPLPVRLRLTPTKPNAIRCRCRIE